jgi:hypothetical protein
LNDFPGGAAVQLEIGDQFVGSGRLEAERAKTLREFGAHLLFAGAQRDFTAEFINKVLRDGNLLVGRELVEHRLKQKIGCIAEQARLQFLAADALYQRIRLMKPLNRNGGNVRRILEDF